jgi:hypothetical protein
MKMLEIKVGRMAAMVAGAAPTRKLAGERERDRNLVELPLVVEEANEGCR